MPGIAAGKIVGTAEPPAAVAPEELSGAETTSAAIIRPPGPVPLPARAYKRRPREAAILRARGETLIRTEEAEPAVPGIAERDLMGAEEADTGDAAESEVDPVAPGEATEGAAPAFSFFPKIMAIRAPTGTLAPASTKSSVRTPSSKASISMVALSVSTSARRSPISMVSPFCLHHRTRVPSFMVSLSLGIVISGMGSYQHLFISSKQRDVGIIGVVSVQIPSFGGKI